MNCQNNLPAPSSRFSGVVRTKRAYFQRWLPGAICQAALSLAGRSACLQSITGGYILRWI